MFISYYAPPMRRNTSSLSTYIKINFQAEIERKIKKKYITGSDSFTQIGFISESTFMWM